MNPFLQQNVENATKVSRKEQLEAYDGVANLRPVWDSIAEKHDAIITPSVVDEAPIGNNTGDPVSLKFITYFCLNWLMKSSELLCYMDSVARSGDQLAWIYRRQWNAYRSDTSRSSIL